MSLDENHGVASLFFVLIWLSAYLASAFGASAFEVTRQQQDIFQNPTVTKCDEKGQEFCSKRISKCAWQYGLNGKGGCCYCRCEYWKSTFDKRALTCEKNTEFRAGCTLEFKNVYHQHPIKFLDLMQKNKADLVWKPTMWNDKVKSCQIDKIVFFHGGQKSEENFLDVEQKRQTGSSWLITVEWEEDVSSIYHGKVFKANMTCTVVRQIRRVSRSVDETRCFVFKSLGSFNVSMHLFPSQSTTMVPAKKTSVRPVQTLLVPTISPSVLLSPSTVLQTSSEPHIAESMPVLSVPGDLHTTLPTSSLPWRPRVVPSSSVVTVTPVTQPPRLLETRSSLSLIMSSSPVVNVTSSGKDVGSKKETHDESMTVSPTSTVAEVSSHIEANADAEEQSDEGDDTVVVISSALGVCVVTLVALLLFILWSRKKYRKPSEKKGHHKGIFNRGLNRAATPDNSVTMNNLESIYAEADDVVSSRGLNGKDPGLYDYIENKANSAYTSLDPNCLEEKPDYQALVNAAPNVYERIPATKNGFTPRRSKNNFPPATSEPFYHTAEGSDGTRRHSPERIYNLLDEPSQPDEYEDAGSVTPSEPGLESSDMVYAVLEEKDIEGQGPQGTLGAEPDYVTVLPEAGAYEQPVDGLPSDK